MARHFSLDSLAVRDDRLFGWGWCLDTASPLVACALDVPLADGGRATVHGVVQGLRSDVADAFPGVPHAAASAYSLRGATPSPIASGEAVFHATFADGTVHAVPLPGFPARYLPAPPPLAARWRDTARLALAGGLGAAARRLHGALVRRLHTVRERIVQAWWRWRIPLDGAVVVLDHAMGGGANRYREARIASHLAEGRTVALLVPRLASLDFRLEVRAPGGRWRIERDDVRSLLGMLGDAGPSAVEINELVTFPDVAAVIGWALRQQHDGARLRFHVHDFHAICPSYTLMDADDRYCGIPSPEVCARCLPRNATHTLGFHQHVPIQAWRAQWLPLLSSADELVAFSQASVQLLQRAFPGLSTARVRIEPHAGAAPPLRLVVPRHARPAGALTVAAVGHLSVAKGADMVNELARRSAERALPLRFVVVGTTDRPTPGVPATGSFTREALPGLLEELGVDACMVPSICPETYSYMTDELMQTGMPLAVFDVGAPPERVRRYVRGVVLPLEPDAALDGIMRAWSGPDGPSPPPEHA